MAADRTRSPSQTALHGMVYVMLGGLTMIVLFSLSAGGARQFFGSASIGLLVAGASALAGGLLGFLFGIPRALQAGDALTAQSLRTVQGAGAVNDQNISYRANTNLEQISDWLTKILVGVGLTQLVVLPDRLGSLFVFLPPEMRDLPHADVMAAAVVLYFSISGFLFSYLWTRLFLAGALRDADVAALGEKISELEMQMSRDAKALNLVQQHLDPRVDSPEIPEADLTKAIVEASPAARTTIFYEAWEVRKRNWRDDDTKPKMERTIPVFRALIDSDVRNEYHTNHGQLGYALKDKREPEWVQAQKELTKAIQIRGDWRVQGYLYYEFNRAICRITLDGCAQNNQPSTSPVRKEILADLQAVASNNSLMELIEQEPNIRGWMEANTIRIDDLRP